MKTTRQYWTISLTGIGLTALVGGLTAFSLEDWNFYYRLTCGQGLDTPEGPLLTRIVWTSRWTLMIPTVALGSVLLWGRAKSPWFACTFSLVGVLTVCVIAYLAAYLPVAKPKWWGDRRPLELLPSVDVVEPKSKKPQQAAPRNR